MGAKRKYQEIWERIKEHGRCELAVSKPYQPRVKKAVIKEKDNDVGYKFLLGEQYKKATLEITTQGSKMIFRLTTSLGLGDI